MFHSISVTPGVGPLLVRIRSCISTVTTSPSFPTLGGRRGGGDIVKFHYLEHGNRFARVRKCGALGSKLRPSLAHNISILRDCHGILHDMRASIHINDLVTASISVEGLLHLGGVVCRAIACGEIFEVVEVRG